jgi:DNA modification methylase
MIHTTQEYQIGDNVELMREMPAESIDTIVTSPPYWSLRDYGVDGQIGLEGTLEEYHARLLEVTSECMRVLKPTGVMFWNHGDNYGGNQGRGAGKGNEHSQMISQRNNGDVLTREGARLAGSMNEYGLDVFDIAVILDVDVDCVIEFVVI